MKPNIILILADDLGYGDLACYGHPAGDTPHTDALAAAGMRLTDFHANGPVCSPTRAALLTGQYQQRCGIEIALGEHDRGLPRAAFTLSRLLAENGYATGLFGKWHLGMSLDEGPNAHAFGEFRGHRHGAVDYFSHVNKFGCIDWWHDEQPASDDGYCTELIARDCLSFVRRHADRPFFLFMSHSAIHFPWMAPEDKPHRRPGVRYDDLSKLGPHKPDDVGQVVRRMIQSLDQTVGQVVQTIADLELADNTVIIFTSDNGGIVEYAGGFQEISSNAPLRGQKGSLYEGGHRVPAIAVWPGRIRPGTVDQQPMATMDLLPTIAAIAGADLPPGYATDGVDLVPAWLQRQELPPRDLFWRSGDQRAARRGAWKLYRRNDATELYRLDEDLAEARDLSALEPQRTVSMLEALEQWENDVNRRHP